MDPYLEDPTHWAGVHTRLIVAISNLLNQLLPPNLVADIDQYVWVTEESDDDRQRVKPDVFIPDETSPLATSDYPTDPAGVSPATATLTLPATTLRKNRVVKIMTIDNTRVLTVIEILSPSNKNSGEDRDAYLSKRREYFAAKTNVVEIDLLRDGDRLPMGRRRPPLADYYVLVARAGEYPSARVWAFGVRDAIPIIPIPLNRNAPAVPLDLQFCLNQVYENNRYAQKLKYSKPPTPALRKPDAEWAADLLKMYTTK
jgi:hypothetical protein